MSRYQISFLVNISIYAAVCFNINENKMKYNNEKMKNHIDKINRPPAYNYRCKRHFVVSPIAKYEKEVSGVINTGPSWSRIGLPWLQAGTQGFKAGPRWYTKARPEQPPQMAGVYGNTNDNE